MQPYTTTMTVAGLALAAAGGRAHADTFDVPGDFATFDEAVDAASDGDTIRLLQPGLLFNNPFIDLGGKALTIERVGGQLRVSDNALLRLPDGSTLVVSPGFGIEAPGTNRIEPGASAAIFADRLDRFGDLILAPGARLDAFLGTDALLEDLLRLDEGASLDVVVAESGSEFRVDGEVDLRPGSRLTLDPQSTLRVRGPLRTDGATLRISELEAEASAEFVASVLRLERLAWFGEFSLRLLESDTRIETSLQGNTSIEILGGTFFARSNDGVQAMSMTDADVTLGGPVFAGSDLRVERSRLEIIAGDLLDARGATIADSTLVADNVRVGALQEPGPVPIRRTTITAFQVAFLGDAVGSGEWFGEVDNVATLVVDDETRVFGQLRNNGALVVQGDLTVFGDFVNDGTVIGEVQTVGPFEQAVSPPTLSVVGGDLIVEGTLSLPPAAVLDLAGGLGVPADDAESIALEGVTVRVRSGTPRGSNVIELAGADALALPGAFDGSIIGTFAVGELIYTAGATADLVPAFAPGAAAVYTDRVVVEPGATLDNRSVTVYARAAEIAGVVAEPANLVIVAEPCVADLDASGTPDFFDVVAYLGLFDAATPGADLDGSGTLDVFDIIEFLGAFDAGC